MKLIDLLEKLEYRCERGSVDTAYLDRLLAEGE